MTEERPTISPPTNIGISMLLVVFLVLCLFTFSTIALVQAQNEYDNATATATVRSEYYDAVTSCETELHALNASAAAGDFSAGDTVERTYAIDDTMALSVTFIRTEDATGGYYRITDFRTTNTTEWSGDDTLTLVQ